MKLEFHAETAELAEIYTDTSLRSLCTLRATDIC